MINSSSIEGLILIGLILLYIAYRIVKYSNGARDKVVVNNKGKEVKIIEEKGIFFKNPIHKVRNLNEYSKRESKTVKEIKRKLNEKTDSKSNISDENDKEEKLTVSPTIGVILMVSLTIIGIMVIVPLVTSLGSTTSSAAVDVNNNEAKLILLQNADYVYDSSFGDPGSLKKAIQSPHAATNIGEVIKLEKSQGKIIAVEEERGSKKKTVIATY